jgi:hypothetical protein
MAAKGLRSYDLESDEATLRSAKPWLESLVSLSQPALYTAQKGF